MKIGKEKPSGVKKNMTVKVKTQAVKSFEEGDRAILELPPTFEAEGDSGILRFNFSDDQMSSAVKVCRNFDRGTTNHEVFKEFKPRVHLSLRCEIKSSLTARSTTVTHT